MPNRFKNTGIPSITCDEFAKRFLKNHPIKNYGDVNYVEYGGVQLAIQGNDARTKSFEFYQLTTPDSGYDGWVLETGYISLSQMFDNFSPNLPISQLVFTSKMIEVRNYVGIDMNIFKVFYNSGTPKYLEMIIEGIVLGLPSYGGYSDADRTWEYQNEYEVEQVKLQVESDLARMGFDL